ncbi:aminomethyl-transferring glycine dehydrogenase subunit GcvPA [Paenibacillus aceris]|uniref:Probable glycine dehydrogenase (decarboxylating) subunit 1 n=1 Tax=Paenibacillus aceris TaxID=869555 RepID=A0ABS4I7E6_9BACL|nr:aminomethyl-transferring glycine dehydrogenase subunit GcvPA [Paenibacillus aceris]MBP1966780.1 glycine dehydrogenase subunit 1 [Paenibacillus aceris]NHW39407.1 aminomethyl-transferring glycine dehydrogenase subunit GcvPA [Paenibacillus aceris]
MKHRYLPITEQDQKEMLETIGISSMEEMFQDIPQKVRFQGELNVSKALDEQGLLRYMRGLSGRNADFDRYASFLGAGIYDHHLPVVINHVISRSEFYTAYTPYQPEISQGELQAIFEFQSYICELTGMAVANASMYDGATALAEAGALASGATKRSRLLVSRAVHPEARAILRTTARGLNLEVVEIGLTPEGVTDLGDLASKAADAAAVILQSPNFFGCLEDIGAAEPIAHGTGALLVVSANPLTLGLLEAPGKLGADIVVGDCQPLGIPAALGGPTCGYFAVAESWMRRMPGRIVGQTVDRAGKRGFVLTLQAREQHIRREKATSNICSNQALLALCASVYLSTMGKQGIQDVGKLNVQKAHYAANRLAASGKLSLPFAGSFFNEFAVKLPDGANVQELNSKLLQHNIIGGYDLGRDYTELAGHMLVAVTEQRTREEIDAFADALEELV